MKIWQDNVITVCSVTSDFLSPITKIGKGNGSSSLPDWKLEVFGRAESFGGVLIHHRTGREALVDDQGFKAYERACQDSASVVGKEIDDYLFVLGRYLMGYNLSEEQIARWFQPLSTSSMFSSPLFLRWEITRHCNLACKHCYTEYQDDMVDLDTKQILCLIEKFRDLRLYQLRFGGGEPFVRKDFLTILQHAQKCGLRPCVVTNGTLIDDFIAKELHSIGLKDIFISLDGATPESHDTLRGRSGAWALTIRGIKSVQKKGLAICIQSMVHQGNLHELDALIDLAISLGVKAIMFKLPIASGKARENSHLSLDQIYRASATIKARRIGECGRIHISDLELSSHSPLNKDDPKVPCRYINCGPGYRSCTLRPDGRIVPCHYLQSQEWQTEPINPDNFQYVWQTATAFAPFRQLNAIDLTECHTCSLFLESCIGGCRALAWLATRNFKDKDPYCLDEKLHYTLNVKAIPLIIRYFKRSEEWLWRDINGSVILYSPKKDLYLKLTKVSSRIWKLLGGNQDDGHNVVDMEKIDSINKIQSILTILHNNDLIEMTARPGDNS